MTDATATEETMMASKLQQKMTEVSERRFGKPLTGTVIELTPENIARFDGNCSILFRETGRRFRWYRSLCGCRIHYEQTGES